MNDPGAPLPPGSLDLLNRLRDLHEPPAPGLWPPAPGWWLLVLLVLLAAVILGAWLRRPRQRLRRAALAELSALRTSGEPAPERIVRLNQLLRRYARARDPGARPEALSLEDWTAYLRRGPDGETLARLARAAYRRAPDVDLESGLGAAEKWIRRGPC